VVTRNEKIGDRWSI